ncbi:hypothetical protein CB1_000389031 [Camelus ferus]|nr:hypothetical protein CB1_000389031 [Camelus ferus]
MAAAHRPPPRLLSGCRGTDLRCGSVAAGSFGRRCMEAQRRPLAVAWALEQVLLFPVRALKPVVFHDVGVLTDRLFPVVEAMQKHFSAGSGTYYSDSIFFLSVAMHQIMPKGSWVTSDKKHSSSLASSPLASRMTVPVYRSMGL